MTKQIPNSKFKSGFSLIELLVALTLIMIMAAGVIGLIGPGPQKYGRDVKRKADTAAIAQALEAYRQDNRGYPECSSGTTCPSSDIAGISPTYITNIPIDSNDNRIYRYTPNNCSGGLCTTYSLCLGWEKLPVPTPTDLNTACGGDCGTGYPCYERLVNP